VSSDARLEFERAGFFEDNCFEINGTKVNETSKIKQLHGACLPLRGLLCRNAGLMLGHRLQQLVGPGSEGGKTTQLKRNKKLQLPS
jgi:hypothetical protein